MRDKPKITFLDYPPYADPFISREEHERRVKVAEELKKLCPCSLCEMGIPKKEFKNG